jgi:hypothetical protein
VPSFSRCEAAFSKRKPNWTRPSVHPPTIRHPVQSGSDYQGTGETLRRALGVVRLSGLLFAHLPKFFCGNLRIGLRKFYVCAPRGEERFSRRSRFRKVLYCLALHAQSLFTAASCLGRRNELVLPGGHSAADLGQGAAKLHWVWPLGLDCKVVSRLGVSKQYPRGDRWRAESYARSMHNSLLQQRAKKDSLTFGWARIFWNDNLSLSSCDYS